MKKDDDSDEDKPSCKGEAKDDDDTRNEAKAEPKPSLRPGDDAPLEELGDYWQGTDGLLRRATAHIYRRIIAPECEGGFREWMDAQWEPVVQRHVYPISRHEFDVLLHIHRVKLLSLLSILVFIFSLQFGTSCALQCCVARHGALHLRRVSPRVQIAPQVLLQREQAEAASDETKAVVGHNWLTDCGGPAFEELPEFFRDVVFDFESPALADKYRRFVVAFGGVGNQTWRRRVSGQGAVPRHKILSPR